MMAACTETLGKRNRCDDAKAARFIVANMVNNWARWLRRETLGEIDHLTGQIKVSSSYNLMMSAPKRSRSPYYDVSLAKPVEADQAEEINKKMKEALSSREYREFLRFYVYKDGKDTGALRTMRSRAMSKLVKSLA